MSTVASPIPPVRPRWMQPLLDRLDARRNARELAQWERAGREGPTPAAYKRNVLRMQAHRRDLHVLVETGTFLGNTVQALRGDFDRIISVELSEELHERALARFKGADDVELLQGDSGVVLRSLVPTVQSKALFWLDGHYSAGFTAMGASETPVFDELESIFRSPVKGHVVLVDDARMFTGEDGWPTIPQLREFVGRGAPEYGFDVVHDIVEIVPRNN